MADVRQLVACSTVVAACVADLCDIGGFVPRVLRPQRTASAGAGAGGAGDENQDLTVFVRRGIHSGVHLVACITNG